VVEFSTERRKPMRLALAQINSVVGDVDEETLRQKKAAAKETVEKNPAPVSKEAIKQQDKAKAVQTGDDATLRDLPSPAEKGSE